ncbi:hypothetical protein PFICI_05605 [Pestalotiopsis fici W106-1]|uniref:Ubiquitin-like protein smt3 n=1 Tax=Pestalotiopsis fici (strain W106-1 / CGMCC3.15140) TaxID=1229662 RepID=W3XCK8_PESFW|nr:uncharacterized protein PFICI_05605 [Pestalotiopsis fici W106-1]ETS83729.1 hypothetical protein PFICI_05605 [Pestalotiopsis fici W106-1]
MAGDSSSGATAALSKLSLDQSKTKPAASKTKKPAVADSWEDESSEDEGEGARKEEPQEDRGDERPKPPTYNPSTPAQSSGFAAPPPTPSTPSYNADASWKSMMGGAGGSSGPGSPEDGRKRPEKTDAVARRMIASALGVKAPRLTDEQRAYDRALRDKERKRREAEKEEEKKRKEDAEKAKLAMWED